MISINSFSLRFAFNSVPERDQFYYFMKSSVAQLTDFRSDCLVKKELLQLLVRMAKKMQGKSLRMNLNWYQVQAIFFVFENFELPDQWILARVAIGRIHQLLPADLPSASE